MAKVMVFVDGTWLYSSTPNLARDYGKSDLHIDYGLLPRALGSKVSEQLRMPEIDIVRTYLFGSTAINYDLRDDDAVEARLYFFNMLKEEFHYEVDLFPIDFRGRRIRRRDRDPNDDFEPKEKCVDIALATSLLYYAAIPHAYDIAIVVIGDRDYIPVLQYVRRLGKRVSVASIKGCCAPEYSDTLDKARVKDVDIIWLNDIIPEIELRFERQQLECESPLHVGNKRVWTTFRPRRGQPFYCDDCRRKFAQQKSEAQREFVTSTLTKEVPEGEPELPLDRYLGEIEKMVDDKGYGFIRGENGKQYFFHITDLENIQWSEISIGRKVTFQVKREPSDDKAGAAGSVRSSPS